MSQVIVISEKQLEIIIDVYETLVPPFTFINIWKFKIPPKRRFFSVAHQN